MGPLSEQLVERRPISTAGLSGSGLEEGRMADGTRLIIKSLSPADDWIMRATHDEGRFAAWWNQGVLQSLPESIEHAVLGVEEVPGGWLIFMKDVSQWLFAGDRVLSREESRRILEVTASIGQCSGFDGLCALADRYATLSPATARREAGGPHVIPNLLGPGWEVFAEVVPADVAEPVLKILDEPSLLADQLLKRPGWLTHGDLKLSNLGLMGERLVLVDWGAWGTVCPFSVEVAWHIAVNSSRVDATREQIIDDFREVVGDAYDETALKLALLGGLVQLGWNKAMDATRASDLEVRAREAADLAWWVDRSREALEIWSP